MSLLTTLVLSHLSLAAEPDISASMQPVQFKGSPLVVDFEIHNSSASALVMPDLSARPDLVRFELRQRRVRERRYNTPDEGTASATWQMPAGAQRELRLEVPGSAGLPVGPLTVDIEVRTSAPQTLQTQRVEVVHPAPVSGDLSGLTAAPGTQHPDVIWVHAHNDSHILVLQHHRGERRYQLALSDLSQTIQPWLSRSRRDALGERSVVWLTGANRLHVLRMRGQRTRGKPSSINLPWPAAQIISHPSTDRDGTLRVPMWIPAPSGDQGELRLATVSGKQPAQFPKILSLSARPEQVLNTVDATGRAVVYVMQADRVDTFTPPAQTGLPWTRRTLWQATSGRVASRIALGDFPATEGFPGGTALLLATNWSEGTATHWRTLQGELLQGHALVPHQGRLQQLVPRGEDWPALLFEGGTVVVGDTQRTVTGSGHLATAQDALMWRTLTQKGPVRDRPILLSD